MRVWATTMRAWTFGYAFVLCVLHVRVCGDLCAGTPHFSFLAAHLCAGTPHFSFFFLLCYLLLLLYHVCITPSLKLSSSLLCGSHGTTAVAHEALPFVLATDGAPVCSCSCHISYRNSTYSREVQGCGTEGRAIQCHDQLLLPRDFKSNRAAALQR